MSERMMIVGVCPQCGHPVHWKWQGNSAKTLEPCSCCAYRGFIILQQVPSAGARDLVREMHERAKRKWRGKGKQSPLRLEYAGTTKRGDDHES